MDTPNLGNAHSNESSGVVPPSVVATPSLVQGTPDEPIQWWTPSWQDRLRSMGYRWIFLVPLAAFIAFIIWFTYFHRAFAGFLVVAAKLLIFLGGCAFAVAAYGMRQAAKARQEPFCIFCGYNLSHLPDNYRCPECGRAYTWALIAEYRRDPRWFIKRWKAQHELPPAPTAFEAGAVLRKQRAKDGTE